MSPSGLIGNVVESYLSAEDNFDKYTGQKSLREELVKLGYVNTKLLGVTYYDLEEQSELIRNINVRNLDQVYQTIPMYLIILEIQSRLCIHPAWESGKDR